MKPIVVCAGLVSLSVAAAQQPSANLSFEVASIKPSDTDRYNPMFIGMSADGAIVRYRNITLRDCIRGAYRMRDFQIVGPPWITDSRFEITATLPKGASRDQIPEVLQSSVRASHESPLRQRLQRQGSPR